MTAIVIDIILGSGPSPGGNGFIIPGTQSVIVRFSLIRDEKLRGLYPLGLLNLFYLTGMIPVFLVLITRGSSLLPRRRILTRSIF